MADKIPALVLRDIFLIWFYASVTRLKDVKDGSISVADLMTELSGSIDTTSEANKKALSSVYASIQNNPDSFDDAKNAINSIPPLTEPWSGSGPHPALDELNSVFIQHR